MKKSYVNISVAQRLALICLNQGTQNDEKKSTVVETGKFEDADTQKQAQKTGQRLSCRRENIHVVEQCWDACRTVWGRQY
jgi:hypothetical protein